MTLDKESLLKLEGVKKPLVDVVNLASTLTTVPFEVTEGLRTKERQQYLLTKGATQTLNSKHLTGDAVDVAALVDGKVSWDWPLYEEIAKAFYSSAKQLGTEILWGGEWKFRDGCHFQLVDKHPFEDENKANERIS